MSLKLGPMDPTAKTDPADPEVAAAFTSRYGAENNTLALIEANRVANPPELVAAGAMPRDDARSDSLDLEELASHIDVEGTIESASVRGLGDDKKVLYLVRWPDRDGAPKGSGRTSRGCCSYSDLSASQSAHEEERDRRLGIGIAARQAGATEEETQDTPTDPRITELRRENDALRVQLANEKKATFAAGQPKDAAEAAREADIGGAHRTDEPDSSDDDPDQNYGEPYDGYDSQNVREVLAHIGDADADEQDDLKVRVYSYESEHQRRAGILTATS